MSDAMETPTQSETSAVLMKPLLLFTSKLFPLAKEGKENVILSPISIHKALSLVLLGTNNSTETESQLLSTLGYGHLNSSQVTECHQQYSKLIEQFKTITKRTLELRENSNDQEYQRGESPPILDVFNMMITNSKLGQVKADYGDKIEKYYHSTIEVVDPKKSESITKLLDTLNEWGKKADFKEPIMNESDLKQDFAALLLSAIRVEAFWFSEFHQYEDKLAFHQMGLASQPVGGLLLTNSNIHDAKYLEFVPPTSKSRFPNLQSRIRESPEGKLYDELAHLYFQLAEVNLEGGLSFAIFEPLNASGSGGGELAKLTSQLMSDDTLIKVITLLDSEASSNTINRLSFPKFQFENELNLNGALQTMGLRKAFDKSQAEIKQMVQQGGVYIDSVKHQAMIEVTKQGIKAAGVTKIKMMLLSAFRPDQPLNVDIRNPFMFMLRFEKIPLFVGQLMRV